MTTTPKKRRSPGEGGAASYTTNSGTLWRARAVIIQPDGTRKPVSKRGFASKTAALRWIRETKTDASRGEYLEPSKQLFGDYLTTYLNGLRLTPSTVASYKKMARLHVVPYIGAIPLAQLTPARLDQLYRQLETSGRLIGTGGGLSPRTVRYIHTIISGALKAAADAGLIARNPCDRAHPPSEKQAKAPETAVWTAAELARFLFWSKDNSGLHPAWHVLAMTGMRRGELLGLKWRDTDLAAGTITIRRSANLLTVKGQGYRIIEGPTKTGKPRVIDIDDATAAVLRAWKTQRGTANLVLAKDDALVFGDDGGAHRHPEIFSRTWRRTVARAIRDGINAPGIGVHGLRHVHAALLLQAGEPVKTVSERLGHANATITMTVYSHSLPGDQRRAAALFAKLVGEAGR